MVILGTNCKLVQHIGATTRVIFTLLCSAVSTSLDNIYINIAIFVLPIEEQFLRKLFKVFDLHHVIGQLRIVTSRY